MLYGATELAHRAFSCVLVSLLLHGIGPVVCDVCLEAALRAVSSLQTKWLGLFLSSHYFVVKEQMQGKSVVGMF